MPQISERWELHIGKKIHIISGEEMKAIMSAGEARFVRFRDLVINPAFVTQMVLIETNALKLEAPTNYEKNLPIEEWLSKHVKKFP